MSFLGSISNLSNTYLQPMISPPVQKPSSGASPVTAPQENGQLSPFAQVMSTLQQLEQTNPTEYSQVTQQIAANLQSAAKTATTDGNSTQATQLNQMATDFTSASQSGQMPNMQDLAQALGGHHHHSHAASGLAAFQANSTQNDSLNPMNIIMNTLSSAGISISSKS